MKRLLLIAATGGSILAACTSTPPAVDPALAQCKADRSMSLIGSHVGAVTFPEGANVRIVCTTCAMTRDYRPDRLNVLFDEQTGIIQELRCG